MKAMRFVLFFLSFAVLLPAQRSRIDLTITDLGETRLAVADFVSRATGSAETDKALGEFNNVLWKDLEFSALFKMPSKSFYPLKPLRLPLDVEFENWQMPSIDADFLAFGNIQAYETAVVVEAYLFDVKTQEQAIGKRYTIADASLIRRVAHQFADDLAFQLSGGATRGVAQTKIAYSSERGGSKEIFVSDYDGINERTVTANRGLNKFPDWSPDNSQLAFVTRLPQGSSWQLWRQELAGGRTVLPTPSSYASSPAWSPDGSQLAFASRSPSSLDSDVFVASSLGGRARNLTRHPSIDTSPTWSPNGQQIAFISDRSGTPQVWMMDSDGTNLRRLVNEGGHCDSPAWSPDGRRILYSWQAPSQWKHDIYFVEAASGSIFQLTSGRGSNESPDWSPDGRHIAFQSDRSGTKQVFIMNADGQNLKQVTAYGINGSPAWSSYFTGN